MEPSSYKDVKTSRGFTYHYFQSSAQDSKPTLLFLHGFPSTSYDWRHQISFFKTAGYGLIVPDMLGYGRTSKPTNVEDYKYSLVSKDIVDIMDSEKVAKAIVIGHDWGALATSRLHSYYPERFTAYAFLAVSYLAPNPIFNLAETLSATKKLIGYEICGYWKFFSEEGADKTIEDNLNSFFSIIYPHSPEIWIKHLCPTGALKACIEEGTVFPRPSYLTEKDEEFMKEQLLEGGFAGSTNWYKLMTLGVTPAEDKNIESPAEISAPVFFGAALRDAVCLAQFGKQHITRYCKNATVKDFDTGHWLQLEAADEVNRELKAWIEGIENLSR